MITIGNTTFIIEALEGITKSEFIKTYSGILNVDIDQAWSEISKYTRKKKSV